MRARHALATGFTMALAALASAAPARVDAPDGPVLLLEVEGVIDPVTERYVARGLERAESLDARLVVLRLDTPGGGLEPMRGIVASLLSSRVPVAVWVGPPGARAASAGMFIAAAAHVAAMAPGTNIGAAHPVVIGGDLTDEQKEKAVNDTAAMVRSIAQVRERNVQWLERAVRESTSSSASEAQRDGVVDLVVADVEALLEAVEGREVTTVSGDTTLSTRGAPVQASPMGLADGLLHAIADPNIAYLLLTLGTLGLAAAAYNPGVGALPGSLGAVCLVTAFFAMGTLPINWAAAVLLVLGVALVVLDALVEGLGPLSIGGALAFVLGSLMLYRPFDVPLGAPRLEVSPWLVALMAVLVVAFLLLVGVAVARAGRLPVRGGVEELRGRDAVALTELHPRGTVAVGTEVWSATTAGEVIHQGEHVRVLGVEGVTLRVSAAPQA